MTPFRRGHGLTCCPSCIMIGIGQYLIPSTELQFIRDGTKRLGFQTLWDYEHSGQWQARRDRYYREHKYACCVCDVRHGLELNHKSYRNLGHEPDSDLEWRCDTHHKAFHAAWTIRAQNEKTPAMKRGFWRMLFFG